MNFASRRHNRYCLPTLHDFCSAVVVVLLSAIPVLYANLCSELSGELPAGCGSAGLNVSDFGDDGTEEQIHCEVPVSVSADGIWTALIRGWYSNIRTVLGRTHSRICGPEYQCNYGTSPAIGGRQAEPCMHGPGCRQIYASRRHCREKTEDEFPLPFGRAFADAAGQQLCCDGSDRQKQNCQTPFGPSEYCANAGLPGSGSSRPVRTGRGRIEHLRPAHYPYAPSAGRYDAAYPSEECSRRSSIAQIRRRSHQLRCFLPGNRRDRRLRSAICTGAGVPGPADCA